MITEFETELLAKIEKANSAKAAILVPALTGTPNQITYANDIRKDYTESLVTRINHADSDEQRELIVNYLTTGPRLLAKWWIENKSEIDSRAAVHMPNYKRGKFFRSDASIYGVVDEFFKG